MCFTDASNCEAYLITLSQGTATVHRAKVLAKAMLECQPTDQAYHDWAADSVLDIRLQLEQCLHSASAPARLATRGSGHARKIALALESVLMSILHSSVMDSLGDLHADADEALYRQAQERHESGCQVLNSSLAVLSGAGKSLVGMDLSGATAQLRRMDAECRCPLEMLRCVNEADRCLADSVSRLRQTSHSVEAVSADDLLSTTIAAIVVAQPQRLVSCLEYLKLFHGTGDWSGKTGFQVATLEAAAAYLEQINPSSRSPSAAGERPRHSQEFVRALLEQDEPLTFASSAHPVSSPMQIPSRHEGVSPDNLRYGHAVSLRELIGEELLQRAASIQRAASLQREASLRRTASGALGADPSQQAQDGKIAGYVQ